MVICAEDKKVEKKDSSQNATASQQEKFTPKTKDLLIKIKKQKKVTYKTVKNGEDIFRVGRTTKMTPDFSGGQYVTIPRKIMEEIEAKLISLEKENKRLKAILKMR
jgi:hypothetical protein